MYLHGTSAPFRKEGYALCYRIYSIRRRLLLLLILDVVGSLIPRKARISEVIDSCAFSFLAAISVLLFIHIGNLMDCSFVWYGLRKESGYKVFLFVGE